METLAALRRLSSASPDGVEPHTYALALGEVGNERQVGDLCGRPPKLEHYDETGEVQYLVWNFSTLARDAVMVDEEDACSHAGCSNKVPGLSSAVVPTPHAVTLITTERSAERVCNLTNEYQSPSHAVGQLDHEVVEHQHVCEPHAGAEVVQNVAHTKRKPSWIRQLLRIVTTRLVLVCKQGLLTVFLPCNSPLRHPPRLVTSDSGLRNRIKWRIHRTSLQMMEAFWSSSESYRSRSKLTRAKSMMWIQCQV